MHTQLTFCLSASGLVYVAKTISSGQTVAIKEVDSSQFHKHKIVNEILAMKESQHPNIINFVDSFLLNDNDLWVVMEYMEGGALNDIIMNNTLDEDQISRITLEVCFYICSVKFNDQFYVVVGLEYRLAKDCATCTIN
jgi:serine/threonine protein kinase